MHNPYISRFIDYKSLLIQLVERDLKLRYRRSALGFIWSILNPLLMMVIMSIVFSRFFKANIKNYPIYLLSGQLLFNTFSEATNLSMTSIIANANLIKKVAMPKYILPFSKTIAVFVNFYLALIALFLVMFVTHLPISFSFFFIIFPLLYLFLVSLGAGLFLSAFSVHFRDCIHLYTVFLTALNYLTPIFYPEDILHGLALQLVHINPLSHIIAMFRNIVLYNTLPTLHSHIVCLGYSMIFMLLGLLFFKIKQDRFILYV